MHMELNSADGRSSGGEEEACFVSVRTITLSRYACGNPSRYTPLAGTGSSSARTTVLPVTSVASSLKTFLNRSFETVEHTGEIRYCEVE